MPHKIAFIVISSSGREDGFSAKELMVHAPTVNGWRSARFCQYPQEIVLQMVERCRIRKLQLLAHQYLISSKIEFYITESLPEYFAPYQSERFHRLGYVSLSDNEKTGYKARELKSVYVDAVGQYLKLVFHKNYVNRYNLYNQVALVAINIIGDPVDYSDESNTFTRGKVIDHYLGSSSDDPALDGTNNGKLDSISPLDDLAFDMYQDPEVAQIIRKLDEAKQEAVKNERYDYAKKLKQAIADLQKVGERLGRYEVEKRCAVEKEDYGLAKQKKEQMEEYRLKVYQQLELHNLLDVGQIRRPPELPLEPMEHVVGPRQQEQMNSPHHKRDKSDEKKLKREPLPTEHPAKRSSPKGTPQPGSPSSPAGLRLTHVLPKISIDALPYDERPLPALRKLQGETFTEPELEPEEESIIDTSRSGITGEPEPLTEKSLREASFAIEVFGEALVAGSYSKTWSYREDALLAVYKRLWEMPNSASKDELKSMLRAAIFLIQRAMKDNVSSVFHAALKLLKMIVTQYIPKHKLGKLETTHCLEKTLPNLIARTGDSATRLRVVASNFIQEMALFKEVKPLQIVPAHLVQPLKQTCPTRLAQSHVELVEHLVKELGTVSSGFTVDNVLRFATRALEHSAFEVREAAVRIILDMYKQHQHSILEYLPPDDATTRKNVLYKTLFDGFAKIDGRPTNSEIKAQRKAAVDEAERQKKEEIRALQEQLAALKIQTEVQTGKMQKKPAMEESEKQKKEETRALHEQLATLKENQAEGPVGKEKEADGQKSKVGGKTTIASPLENADDQSSVTNYLDKLCIFCGERDESFTEEGLDLHYWKHCPMLKRCEHCKQVVEIASLTEHLLTECDKKDTFGKCQFCSEAIPKEELAEHVKAKTCNPAKPEKVANRCPLCHENFTPGEEAWKFHLMGRDGCKMNLRRTGALQRTQPLQQGKTGGLTVPKPVFPGSKMRTPASGSKIPAPRAGMGKTTGKTQPTR